MRSFWKKFNEMAFGMRVGVLFLALVAGGVLAGLLAVAYAGDRSIFMGGFIPGMFLVAFALAVSARNWLGWYARQDPPNDTTD